MPSGFREVGWLSRHFDTDWNILTSAEGITMITVCMCVCAW